MVVVILGMLVCIVLSVIVLALVALPAHRGGDVLFVGRESRPTGAETTGADSADSDDAAADAVTTTEPVAVADADRTTEREPAHV